MRRGRRAAGRGRRWAPGRAGARDPLARVGARGGPDGRSDEPPQAPDAEPSATLALIAARTSLALTTPGAAGGGRGGAWAEEGRAQPNPSLGGSAFAHFHWLSRDPGGQRLYGRSLGASVRLRGREHGKGGGSALPLARLG